jgi:hypothetical protein
MRPGKRWPACSVGAGASRARALVALQRPRVHVPGSLPRAYQSTEMLAHQRAPAGAPRCCRAQGCRNSRLVASAARAADHSRAEQLRVQQSSGGDSFRVFYRTNWQSAVLHGSVNGRAWADYPLQKVISITMPLYARQGSSCDARNAPLVRPHTAPLRTGHLCARQVAQRQHPDHRRRAAAGRVRGHGQERQLGQAARG